MIGVPEERAFPKFITKTQKKWNFCNPCIGVHEEEQQQDGVKGFQQLIERVIAVKVTILSDITYCSQ